MDFKTCKFCKNSFRGFTELCPTCVEQLDEKYVKVRNYLYKSADSNVSRVSKETGVDEKSILFLIREGNISVKNDGVKCLKCGATIHSGRYCEECMGNIVKSLESTKKDMTVATKPRVSRNPLENAKGRMHMLNSKD